ncbi:MAG: hypothetical protein U1F23_10710, partial [Lysobacterales bacterium]
MSTRNLLAALSLLAAGMLLPTSRAAADRGLELPASVEPGQLVIAHAPRGTRLEFDGRILRVGDD